MRVLRGDGGEVCRRRVYPTVASQGALQRAALAGAAAGTRLEVVIEPTGAAWLPVAVFFIPRGHSVFRVSAAKAADLRRFFSRHAKSNGIDAAQLARLPLVDPGGLPPLRLAERPEQAALDRRVRATDRLTRAGAEHKRRIKDLVRQLMPTSPLTGDLGVADLAVLERYADPNGLLRLGAGRLTTLIAKASNNHLGAARAGQWLAAAGEAVELYGAHPAVAYTDLAAEVATEVRLLRAGQAELAGHTAEREDAYRYVDAAGLARSLPGLAEVGGPALTAGIGEASRFPNRAAFRAFTGLAPKASETGETGETDRKGQPMSKAGSSLLRTTLVRAADTARKQDPQLPRIYDQQMTERGKDHLGAICVVAAHLAERAWAVMVRGMPYDVCDVDGTPVTSEQAKAIVAERYTVPADVRARRRSKKTTAKGKAPHQVRAGHVHDRSARSARHEATFPDRILRAGRDPVKALTG